MSEKEIVSSRVSGIKIKLLNMMFWRFCGFLMGFLAVFLRLESCRVLVLVFLVLVGFFISKKLRFSKRS